MHAPVLVTAPSVPVISRDEAKKNSRVTFADDDALFDAFIAAATAHMDGWTGILGRCLCEQTWRQDFDGLSRCLRLPLAPVLSITSVKYRDDDNALQTIDAGDYALRVDELGPLVVFNDDFSYPAPRSQRPNVEVTYKAGYETTPEAGQTPASNKVPDALKQAMKLLVSHWYANRETVVVGSIPAELPKAFDALVAPYRRVAF